MNYKEYYNCFLDIIFPRKCSVCGINLSYQEKHLCISCIDDIPLTHLHSKKFNEVEQLYAGKVAIEKATSLFYYFKGSKYGNILHDIKYHNNPTLARWITKRLCQELLVDGFFDDIDVIIPIPLHLIKEAERGYNQSQFIAMGIADITSKKVLCNLSAKRQHATQTNKGITARWENTQDLFIVKKASELENKHILLVDDVITTGATTISGARELLKIAGVKVSILSMALSKI